MSMSKQEFLSSAGLEIQTLELWLEQRWLIPRETTAGMHFSERDMARANLILELKSDFGVNDEGVDVILHLMDQLHGMRGALAELQEHIRGKPA